MASKLILKRGTTAQINSYFTASSGAVGEIIMDTDKPALVIGTGANTKEVIEATSAVPVGAILPYAGNTAPTGYQICDGSAAATSELQAITGTNVPDLRGMFIRGTGTNGSNSSAVGSSLLGLQGHAIQQHSHTMFSEKQRNGDVLSNNTQTVAKREGSAGGSEEYQMRSHGTQDPSRGRTHVEGANGTFSSTETRPSNVSLNYIIKT